MVLQTFWLTMGEHYGTISDMNRCFTMENNGTFLWIYFELSGKLLYYIMDLLWIKTVQNNDTLPNTMMLNQKFWNLCWFTTENNILYHSINSVHFAIVLLWEANALSRGPSEVEKLNITLINPHWIVETDA